MSDYTPIDCQLHDEFEIAAMRRQPVAVELLVDGQWQKSTVIPLDTRIRNGEEFLIYRTQSDEAEQRVRLDKIRFYQP